MTRPDVVRAAQRVAATIRAPAARRRASAGQERRAAKQLRAQDKAARDAYRSIMLRVREALANGDHESAERACREALGLGPQDASAWTWLARVQYDAGHVDQAADSIARALALRPDWLPALSLAAGILSASGRAAEQRDVLARLAAAAGGDPGTLRVALRMAVRAHEHALALRFAEALLELAPDEDDALAARAIARWESGARDAARAGVRAGLATGEQAHARAALRFFVHVDELDDAVAALGTIEAPDVADVLALGRGLFKRGQLEQGLAILEEACAIAPDHAAALRARDSARAQVRVFRGRWRARNVTREKIAVAPQRVLHMVGRSLPHHQVGYTVRTQYAVRALRDAGIDAQAVTQLGFPWAFGVTTAPSVETVDGVPYHRLRAPAGDGLVAMDQRLAANVELLRPLVRGLGPAILHPSSDFLNAQLALELRRAIGLPVVYEVRGFWEDSWVARRGGDGMQSEYYRLRADAELACMMEADRVITLADVMKRQIVARGIPADKITVVPNAVDVRAFRPMRRDDGLATELGIEPGEVVVGSVSALVAYEGFDHLLAALAMLVRRGRRVRGLLVGDGDQHAHLRAEAARLGIADRVVFTGRVPHAQVPRYLSLLDVFVVPRTNDRVSRLVTPLKPFEAMASSRTLAVSRVPPLEEIVRDGETGVMFEPDDPESMAEAIDALVEDPDARRRLGQAAREWVCAGRTWAHNAERYRDVYAQLGAG